MKLFWEAQQRSIETTIAKQQLRPRHSINIPLVAAVLQSVHGYALLRMKSEHSKLPTTGPPLDLCTCTTQKALGLPCQHIIYKRKQERGVILLEDIHRHWYYSKLQEYAPSEVSIPIPLPVLKRRRHVTIGTFKFS